MIQDGSHAMPELREFKRFVKHIATDIGFNVFGVPGHIKHFDARSAFAKCFSDDITAQVRAWQ